MESNDRIARAFARFHADNPHVYEGLRKLALQVRRVGRDHYDIGALFEVLRFEHAIETTSGDGLKLNNNYRALYARLLMDQEPELDGFFQLRERKPRYDDTQIHEP